MRKILLFAVLFLFVCLGGLAALDSVFTGLGVEVNNENTKGCALGGALIVGLDINKYFGAGLKVAFSHNFDAIGTLETAALFRYYLPIKINGLFLQTDLGAAFLFEYNVTYPVFLGELTAGWRFMITKIFYLEPVVRAGYPFMWGAGLTAGLRFSSKAIQSN